MLRAIAHLTIDHRSADFAELGADVLTGLNRVFQTSGPVVIYPASGTRAWEAALVHTLSPGDRVLAFVTGEFARLWADLARRIGLDVQTVDCDWTLGVEPQRLKALLREDRDHRVQAVLVVHNETSTGVTSRLPATRRAMDAAGHPALLLVDAVSSLASIDLRHDEWGIDVTLSGSQKGLMLPPGLGFNAIRDKALHASRTATLPKSYWAWGRMLASNATGFFPFTPSTNLLCGLRVHPRRVLPDGHVCHANAASTMLGLVVVGRTRVIVRPARDSNISYSRAVRSAPPVRTIIIMSALPKPGAPLSRSTSSISSSRLAGVIASRRLSRSLRLAHRSSHG